MRRVQTVIQTPDFLKDAADAGLSEEEVAEIVIAIPAELELGERMEGTGGARNQIRGSRQGQERRISRRHLFWWERYSGFYAWLIQQRRACKSVQGRAQ
jgi:hypothetical protein